MSAEKQPHQVFEPLATLLAFLVRGRVWRMDGVHSGERFDPIYSYPQADGSTKLLYHRRSDGHGVVEFTVAPGETSDIVFGKEHITHSEELPSNEEIVDARHHAADVEVNFRDLFGETKSSETTDSAGGSLETTVEAEESVEGVASFKESVTAEVHAEFSRTEGHEESSEQEGETATTVKAGTRARIIQTRTRQDGEVEITANGLFTVSNIIIGKHSGGKFVGGHNAYWASLQDAIDALTGQAPSNIDLAESFKHHPVGHDDRWALGHLEQANRVALRFKAKYEGRLVKRYTVEDL